MKLNKRIPIFKSTIFVLSFFLFLYNNGGFAKANGSPPDEFPEVLLKINVELENIEKIPPEFSEEISEDGVVTGKVNFDKRAQFVENNKKRYFILISELSSLVKKKKSAIWYDDILFLRAYFMFIIANLNMNQENLDHAILFIDEYLSLDETYGIEEKTQEIFRSSIWKNLEPYYSHSGSEKIKLNQFFHLCQARLFEQTNSLREKAIIAYEKALEIDSSNIWGQQATMRIKALE